MSSRVLNDGKVILGFISSIVLSLLAIALAMNNNSFWVLFVIISLVVSTLSVFRADKLYKNDIND